MRKLFTGILLVTAAAGLLTWRGDPVFIYNGSPSVPPGLYRRMDAPPRIGSYVTVPAAVVARDYAQHRQFSDATDRFIKRIAATEGALVCAEGSQVSIGHTHVVTRASEDSMGRTLPRWSGCRRLGAGEVFLLGDTPDSFDSRYWGPVRLQTIDGVWVRVRWPAGFLSR